MKKRYWTKTFLNPAQKGLKYATELSLNTHLTNDWEVKQDKNGNELKLNDKARAYRSGYLDARTDNANCFKHNRKKAAEVNVINRALILDAE